MRTYIYTILAATALVMCASCTKDVCDSESDRIVVNPTLQETKATLIPAGSLTDCRIHIDGYNTTSGVKHLDGNILYEGGQWIFYTDVKNVHYYWPQNSNLDVMAYSPAKLANTYMEITTKSIVTCTGLPMTRETQEGTLLNEFICGYKADCKQSDGAISITMSRPFAIVNFFLDEAVRSKLIKIEITGIHNKGVFDVNSKSWTSTANPSTLLCDVNKEYPTQINNASHLGGPFIVIPQSLRASDTGNEVKLVLTYVSKGNTNETITETTIGQAALASASDTKIGQWESGKEYNYWISLNGAANEIRMAVTIREWKVEGSSETEVK